MLRLCTLCLTEKLPEHFGKKSASKDGLDYVCKACNTARVKAWRLNNIERSREYKRQYYQNTADFNKQRYAEYRKKNAERLNANKLKWQRENKDRYFANHKAWRDRNKDKVKAWVRRTTALSLIPPSMKAANHRARKLRATPLWANVDEIKWFYRTAKYINDFSDVKFDVDHIVPLNSKIVCGLHNEFNLQLLPATTNKEKGNRHWPDMP